MSELTIMVEDLSDEALVELLAACAQNGRDIRPGKGGNHVSRMKTAGRIVAGELWIRGYALVAPTETLNEAS